MAQLSDKNFVGQLGLDPVVLQMTQLSDKKKITEMANKLY